MLWGDLASGSCSGDPTPRVSLSSSACSQIPLPSKPSLNALLLHLTRLGAHPQAPMPKQAWFGCGSLCNLTISPLCHAFGNVHSAAFLTSSLHR